MVELLPQVGVALPDGSGVLRFGMGPDEIRGLLTSAKVTWLRQCMARSLTQYRELRHAHDAWLNRILFEPGWNFNAAFDGVVIGFGGGGPGHTDHLARIDVWVDRPATGSEATAVVWNDIDLFGHPTMEVETMLPGSAAAPGPPPADVVVESLGLRLWRGGPAAPGWREVTLLGPASGRWDACCGGGLLCVKGGDARVGR